MSDSPVIDPAAIEGLRALDPDNGGAFLIEIIGIFLEDTPQRIVELEHSLAAGDATKFARAAHSMKGSSSNLGALALRAVAEDLEQKVRKQGLDGVAPLLAQLKVEFERARVELTKLLPAKPA
jgi:HPt (histidine-containing phosphotransfer) domain-containing protein